MHSGAQPRRDGEGFAIHPALLDGCLQAAAASFEAWRDISRPGLYLPVELGFAYLTRRPSPNSHLWSHVRRHDFGLDGRNAFDIRLLDERGDVLFEARDLRLEELLERRTHALHDVSNLFHEIAWEEISRPPPTSETLETNSGRPGAWLVFSDSTIAPALVPMLRRQGHACWLVSPGADFERIGPEHYHLDPGSPARFRKLIDEIRIAGPWRGVLYLWGLEGHTREPQEFAGVHLWRAAPPSSGAGGCEPARIPRLWVVTSGVQLMDETTSVRGLQQSPIWGLCWAVAHEYPQFNCTRIDLSSHPCPEEVQVSLRNFPLRAVKIRSHCETAQGASPG